MKKVAYFISGHGFGHAVRSALVIRELYGLGIRSEIVTSAPKFIFECNLKGVDFGYHHSLCDAGVVQRDALNVDLPATLGKWLEVLDFEKKWIEGQLDFLSSLKARAVVADIVPSAFPLAKQAGLPSFLLATFTWDWILDFYKEDDPRFVKIAESLKERYMTADQMIFTPLSFGLPAIEPKHFVGLIGRKSATLPESLREKLGLDKRPAFLVSFGGSGFGDVGKMELDRMTDFQFVFLSEKTGHKGNLITFSEDEVSHADLVAVSDAVITKPGYGISAEAILNRTPMIYTSRGKFAEYEPLAGEIKKYIPARFIAQEDLLSGGLEDCLKDPPKFDGDYLTDSGTGARQTADIIAKAV